MDSNSEVVYEEFNKKWKIISKLILGEELGELIDFKKWLVGTSRTAFVHKSNFSGKPVHLVLQYYPDNAKFASIEEIDLNKKYEPLDINEIKDIDSIAEAVQERVVYTGNMHLGECKYLSESTDVVSSSYIYSSAQVAYSKWIAYSYNLEYCEYLFGCQNIGTKSSHAIRSTATDAQIRCLETHTSSNCYDCYYGNSLYNCNNCMFSFGLRNSSYKVGNLQLNQEEYGKLKKKLLAEIIDELKRKKSIPQLENFFVAVQPNLEKGKEIIPKSSSPEPTNQEMIEDAFRTTTKIVLGKALSGLDRYGAWLKRYSRDMRVRNSVLSGERLLIPDYSNLYNYPENRLVNLQEIISIGKNITIDKNRLGDLSLKTVGEIINDVAFFSGVENFGVLKNNIESEINVTCQNFYKSILNLYSKFGAFNFHAFECEYLFGTYSLRKCKFSIRCYMSADLTRCFEVDSSRNCSDCYFCHNCENLRESMFCFNVKNLSYAIGNVELPKEKYMELKKKILGEIVSELEGTNDLGMNIFNLVKK